MYSRAKKALSPMRRIFLSKLSTGAFAKRFKKQLKYYAQSKFAQDAIKARYGIPIRD